MYKFCPFCGSSKIESIESGFDCLVCHKKNYLNSKPTSTVLGFYQDELLLAVRAREPHKGEYDLIGGFLMDGEDPIEGAVREFKEETGLILDSQKLDFLGIWIDEYLIQGINYHTFNVTYTYQFDHKPDLVAQDDIEKLLWIPINQKVELAFKSASLTLEAFKQKLNLKLLT
jgi:NAD+ diphosphatase